MERLPLLAEAEISAEWAGLYEVTPDDQPKKTGVDELLDKGRLVPDTNGIQSGKV